MNKPVTVEVDRYRLGERVANAGASVLHALGLPWTSLDVDDMKRAARSATRLDDFGGPEHEQVLRFLVELLEGASITPLARVFSRSILVRALVNRLRIQAYLHKHPEVRDIPVRAPIFVVGFPRTGTTVMQNLLALHPERRALQFWELTGPLPVYPDPAEDQRRRIASTQRMLDIAYYIAPEMGEVHAIGATTFEECWSLFANTIAVLNYDFQSGIRAFGDRMMRDGIAWAYAEYRTMLQILLHQRPAQQLVLKCPEHLWFLDDLLQVFPDACVVWTHREPFAAIASYSSLISLNRRVYYGRFFPREIGPYIVDRFHTGIQRALDTRTRHPAERFFDLSFRTVNEDPLGAVRQLHERFGFDHPAGMDEAMRTWLSTAREDEKGRHKYDPVRYGLDRDAIYATYAPYMERFGLTRP